MNPSEVIKALNSMSARLRKTEAEHAQLRQEMAGIASVASPEDEINALPGRRVFYSLTGRISFDATIEGQRANPISMSVSQDGPFVMTHYPIVGWIAQGAAPQAGKWSPVNDWPLPAQDAANIDTISISYEFQDSGSGRNFQNEPVPPILSRPDNFVKLPVPTMFSPNSTIQFVPTFESVKFDGASGTTSGILVVSLPGYKIANM